MSWCYISRKTQYLGRCEESPSCHPVWSMYLDGEIGIQALTHPPTLEFTLLLKFYDSIYETEYESLKYCQGKEI